MERGRGNFERVFRRRCGQAMVEFVVLAGILMALVAVMALFLYAFKEYGGRVLDLVAAEFP